MLNNHKINYVSMSNNMKLNIKAKEFMSTFPLTSPTYHPGPEFLR